MHDLYLHDFFLSASSPFSGGNNFITYLLFYPAASFGPVFYPSVLLLICVLLRPSVLLHHSVLQVLLHHYVLLHLYVLLHI